MKHLKIDFFKMIMLIVALISGVTAFAQTTIEGLVVDGTKEPIIGASVFVKGTSTGTATDFDGRFTLKVPSNNAILVISYVGCQSREIVANSPEVKAGIVLKEDAQNLEELVVIGYGSVKKQDATGSVMAIKPDELNKGNRVSAQDALVGKMAGVNVVSSTGAPGEGATIRIRSGASLSASNDPLIVSTVCLWITLLSRAQATSSALSTLRTSRLSPCSKMLRLLQSTVRVHLMV